MERVERLVRLGERQPSSIIRAGLIGCRKLCVGRQGESDLEGERDSGRCGTLGLGSRRHRAAVRGSQGRRPIVARGRFFARSFGLLAVAFSAGFARLGHPRSTTGHHALTRSTIAAERRAEWRDEEQ